MYIRRAPIQHYRPPSVSSTEFNIKDFIRNLDIKTFLEVGCHFGIDTIDFRNMHPNSRIICFEPDPRNLKVISEQGIHNIAEVYPYALSNENGKSKFYLSSGDAHGRVSEAILQQHDWSCSSSLKRPTGHLSMHNWITFEDTVDVETIRLDDFDKIDKTTVIDFMWVDVQGAEDIVFKGSIETLKRTRYVYTEYSNQELYQDQLSRDQIIALFGDSWEIVHDFGGDVLLENINLTVG